MSNELKESQSRTLKTIVTNQKNNGNFTVCKIQEEIPPATFSLDSKGPTTSLQRRHSSEVNMTIHWNVHIPLCMLRGCGGRYCCNFLLCWYLLLSSFSFSNMSMTSRSWCRVHGRAEPVILHMLLFWCTALCTLPACRVGSPCGFSVSVWIRVWTPPSPPPDPQGPETWVTMATHENTVCGLDSHHHCRILFWPS